MTKKTSQLILLLASLFILEQSTMANQTASKNPKSRQDILKEMKGEGKANLSDDDQDTLDAKSKARALQGKAGQVVSTTDQISGVLASSNFMTNTLAFAPVGNPTAVIGLFVNFVGVVGKGIEAYGRRKEAIAEMAFGKLPDLNDINEATTSLEKIEALTEMEEKLTDKQAVKDDLQDEEMSRIKKLSTYLNPSSLKASFNKFTDSLRITNNRKNTEENSIKIRAQRKIEELNFDTIVKKLQARFLNRMMLGLQDALDKVQKIQNKQLKLADYKAQLNKDIQDAKDVLTKFESLGVPPTNKKKMNQYSKEFQAKQARQAIFIQKLTVRLDTFETTYNNPEKAKKELEALKKEMLELKPASHAKPTESGPKTDENVKQIQDQVGALTQRLNALEKQVTALTGKAQRAR